MSQAYAHDVMIRVIAQHLHCLGYAACEAQVLELLCSRVEQFITQRGRVIAELTSHQRRNKSNLLHVLLADPSINDFIVNNGVPLADVQRMSVAVGQRTKWLTEKYDTCRRVAKQIRDQGLAVSSFPAKRLATTESRFGDVADVPQLPLPEKFAADCKALLLPPFPALHTVTRTPLDTQAERLRQGISSEQRHVEQAIIDLSQSETLEANKARSHVAADPRLVVLSGILRSAGGGGSAAFDADSVPIQDAGALAAFQTRLPEQAQHYSVLLKETDAGPDADAMAAKSAKLPRELRNAKTVLAFDHSNDLKNEANTGLSSEAGDSVRI